MTFGGQCLRGFGVTVFVSMILGLSGCAPSGGSAGGGGDGPSGEIVLVSRQNNSGTYAYFKEAVLGKEGEFKQGTVDLSGSKDVVEQVSKTENAIGYSGMGYATEHVKMLSLSDGGAAVAPTSENASNGTYPLARGLNIYVAEVYMEKFPQVKLEVSGGGSGVGLAGLQKETTQMANASRDIKEKEKVSIKEKFGKEVKGYVVALDALAVYVHPENPLSEISLDDLKGMYGDGGTTSEWEQVSNWPAAEEAAEPAAAH